MKIVVDTSDFISAMIGKAHRQKLRLVLQNDSIELFADANLLTEMTEVAGREKFRKYVSFDEATLFIETIKVRLTVISPQTTVTDSPDPDDNYLLGLAVDAQGDYLITGDKKHLLVLNPYRGIKIMRLQAFLDILS